VGVRTEQACVTHFETQMRLGRARQLDVNRISETRPSTEALRRYPEELTPTVSEPSFIVYRLWRRP
jgi:hypothetical protein